MSTRFRSWIRPSTARVIPVQAKVEIGQSVLVERKPRLARCCDISCADNEGAPLTASARMAISGNPRWTVPRLAARPRISSRAAAWGWAMAMVGA